MLISIPEFINHSFEVQGLVEQPQRSEFQGCGKWSGDES
jgi:hypothetical protein